MTRNIEVPFRTITLDLTLRQPEGRASGPIRAVYHRGDRVSLLLADGAVLALAPSEARAIVRAVGPNLAGCAAAFDGARLRITKEAPGWR